MTNEELKRVFDTLEKVFATLGIDYFLIGAMARQEWYRKADMNIRMTRDVDYAVLVGSHDEYGSIKSFLVENEGYTESTGNAFALITPDGVTVDILPFGEIESEGSGEIEGTGMTSIRVDGMKEVYLNGTELLQLDTGNFFKVATLTGITLLKFIAYDDRPENRQKDAVDIGNIVMNFFNLHDSLIYENHNDLFGEEERQLENIGAVVLGREMRKLVGENNQLLARLEKILATHIEKAEKSEFVRLMVKETGKDVETVLGYLKDILWGLANVPVI